MAATLRDKGRPLQYAYPLLAKEATEGKNEQEAMLQVDQVAADWEKHPHKMGPELDSDC